jgi:hypothetical protein
MALVSLAEVEDGFSNEVHGDLLWPKPARERPAVGFPDDDRTFTMTISTKRPWAA